MTVDMLPEFVGAGWAFPLRTDATGSVALVTGEREIVESIRLILATAPGERPMRPEFGCAIHDLVFAPADAATAGQIAYEVRVSLERWEPRVLVGDVVVHFDGADRGVLLIEIRYSLRGGNDPRNLVFPFYVIPMGDSAVGPDPGGVASRLAPHSPAPEEHA
jgi:Bacteriophage baseplate protein W